MAIKVGPCMRGTGLVAPTPPETPSATSSVARVTPMVRYPPVSALPTHMMSGDTSACSQAKSLAAVGVHGGGGAEEGRRWGRWSWWRRWRQ